MADNKSTDFIIEGKTLVKYTGAAKTVKVPNGVAVIGESAFEENHDIVTVDLNEATEIKARALYFCKNLKKVVAKNVKTVGHSAFRANLMLKTVVFGAVERIDDYAFFDGLYLAELVGTERLVYLGDSALDGADLTHFKMSNDATYIGPCAFRCSDITEFDFPDCIEVIESCVFAGCDGLRRVTLPKKLKTIKRHAFSDCYMLRRIELPESLTDIEPEAFDGCNIAEVYNKTNIDIVAGRGKPGGRVAEFAISVFTTEADDTHTVIDGFVFCTDSRDNGRTYLTEYIGNKNDLILPRDCNGRDYGIYRMAFAESDITSIDLGDGVTEISNLAFYKCEQLKSVKFGSGLKTIYRLAFKLCEKLKCAELPDSTELLGSGAFLGTGIEYIKFGSGMKEIRSANFDYCRAFHRIYYTGTPEQFEAIKAGGGCKEWFKKIVRYYSETPQNGCWHYADGEIKEY
ncbi:MAG: leucine-rich repeat domain-containing protein [Roseburia sp.]|nr:leucine-rich repeat domain-containing protein [Roseburia sp.]